MGLLVLQGLKAAVRTGPCGNGNQSQASFEGPPGTPGPCLEEVELLSMYHSEAGLYPQIFPATENI